MRILIPENAHSDAVVFDSHLGAAAVENRERDMNDKYLI
jgi:hypothetical protein